MHDGCDNSCVHKFSQINLTDLSLPLSHYKLLPSNTLCAHKLNLVSPIDWSLLRPKPVTSWTNLARPFVYC